MSMQFPCTRCGACCRFIGKAIASLQQYPPSADDLAAQMLLEFPYGLTTEGACEKYDPVLGCTIYDERPAICRIDRMYELHYKERMQLDWVQYLYVQAAMCNVLIDIFEIDPQKKVWLR